MNKSVALFIPCYIDQLYPQVGVATVKLLKFFDIQAKFPENQICCGQPLANSGCFKDARHFANSFNEVFKEFEYIVCPSGSCTSMIRNHYKDILDEVPKQSASNRVYELCEFLLVDILNIAPPKGYFPKRVGIHQACHGLRELNLGSHSEIVGPYFNKMESLLKGLEGIEIIELKRKDECCGFGGSFAIDEAAVSARMGEESQRSFHCRC